MLNLDWNIVWTFVNIIVLYLLLKLFLFKPLNRMMEKRSASIAATIDEANKKNDEADAIKAEYQQALQTAKDESKEILKQARETAAAQSEGILEDARQQAASLLENAHKTIALEQEKALRNSSAEISELAMLAASKVIEEKTDTDVDRKLVERFLADTKRA